MPSRRPETIAKREKEQARREKRERKQAKKDARANGEAPSPDELTSDDVELEPGAPDGEPLD